MSGPRPDPTSACVFNEVSLECNHAHSFTSIVYGCFTLPQQTSCVVVYSCIVVQSSLVVVTETMWSAKPKIFTWFLMEKFCQPLGTVARGAHYVPIPARGQGVRGVTPTGGLPALDQRKQLR